MDLNQVIYTVFHAEFESGSRIGPKPPQDPIFKDFLKIMFFYKNPIFIDFYRVGGIGRRPFLIVMGASTKPAISGTRKRSLGG